MSNPTSLYQTEGYLVSPDEEIVPTEQYPVMDTGPGKTLEEFSLQDVVTAVANYLNSMLAKLVNIEVNNLCNKDVLICCSIYQLKQVLTNTIENVQRSYFNRKTAISVIIHELRRPTDGNLLPKGTSTNGTSSEDADMRNRYIGVSVKVKFDNFPDTKSRIDPSSCGSNNISYYDGGIIVKLKPSILTIYLARYLV